MFDHFGPNITAEHIVFSKSHKIVPRVPSALCQTPIRPASYNNVPVAWLLCLYMLCCVLLSLHLVDKGKGKRGFV